MPPKKVEEEEPRVLLGRPSNSVKMGIVGLPNVGKSTFFNLLCKMNVPAENRPFCTIDPNTARVPVPDPRFDHLVEKFSPKSIVPAMLFVTDIAGLVAGAAEGAGLGNEFLSHIAAVDGLFHVCRAFSDPEVIHVDGSVDPVRDLRTIHNELQKKDLKIVIDQIATLARHVARGAGGKEKKFEHDVLVKVQEGLEAGIDVRAGTWAANEIEILNTYNFLTAKPMIYLANLSQRDYIRKGNKWLSAVADFIKARGAGDSLIPFSCEFEQAVAAVESGGPEAVLKVETELGAKSSLPRIIKAGYRGLQLIHFFTAGEDEVKAWTIRAGTKAPQAAGVIHTDFEHGFICAEVQAFDDFKECGSEAAVRSAGKLRTEGRKYTVADGDIIFFKFNVTTRKK